MKHFSEEEFSCKCGACDKGYAEMQPSLIDHLQVARELAGTSFRINSAIRCQEHNANIGGVDTSAHLSGHAVDIAYGSSQQLFKIVKGLLDAGFTRVLIYSSFVHADTDDSKPQHILKRM
jgi:uncharacterized protein YcbK (DUF882 family)